MISKEFLDDYDQKETECRLKFQKDAMRGDFSSCLSYFMDRFHNVHLPISEPHAKLLYRKELESIWCIIPLSGTTVMTLIPSPVADFEKEHKFRIKDIPDILDYIKETGKLQFVLRGTPSEYKHLDCLEPILDELRPPRRLGITPEAYFDPEEIRKSTVEFETLAAVRFIDFELEWSKQTFGSIGPALANYDNDRAIYVYLRCMNYDQLAEEMRDALVADIPEFHRLVVLSRMLVDPLANPTGPRILMDREFREQRDLFSRTHVLPGDESAKLSFPGEIGTFLFRRLVHHTPTLESCKQLSFLYEERDLYKVAQALSEAISAQKVATITAQSSEISVILNNIWEDKKVQRKVVGVKGGFVLLFAVIGAVANGLSGAGMGLLAGLGLDVAGGLFGFKDEAISEKIGKFFSSSYDALVYDFRKKYPTTTSSDEIC